MKRVSLLVNVMFDVTLVLAALPLWVVVKAFGPFCERRATVCLGMVETADIAVRQLRPLLIRWLRCDLIPQEDRQFTEFIVRRLTPEGYPDVASEFDRPN